MNVKKAIKRIAALAVGATMVTTTIMGAMALDLGDYPAPFVEDGVFNGRIVIGQTAKVTDVIGAIDIAASLQAAAKSPVEGTSGSETVSVTGSGAQLMSGSDDLILGDSINGPNAGKYDDAEFPDLLADGMVEDEDGTEYEYNQYINVPNANVVYTQVDDYGDMPLFAVDLGAGATTTYIEYVVEFDDNLNVTELEDSEEIEMFGKVWTFDPNHASTDDLTLYGSDLTVDVSQTDPVTVEVDGEEYTIEVLGGNTDDASAIIRVTGSSTSTKTLTSGQSRTMAGLDIFIDDVFISNIGEDTISVSIFVGSEEIVIDSTSYTAAAIVDGDFETVQVNGDDMDGVEAAVKATDSLNDVEEIRFRVDLTEFVDPATDSEDDYELLIAGAEFEDPLFGFALANEGFTPAVEGRHMIELDRSGEKYVLNFENNDGDEYSLDLFEEAGTNYTLGEYLTLNHKLGITEDEIFILQDDAGDEEEVTNVYQVTKINYGSSASDQYVRIEELSSGTTSDYQAADEIGDSGVTIAGVDRGEGHFNLSAAASSHIRFNGGVSLNLSRLTIANASLYPVNDSSLSMGNSTLVFVEDNEDMDDATMDSVLLQVNTDSDGDIQISSDAGWVTGTYDVTDKDGDYAYGMSQFGTWYEQEVENEGDYFRLYYSEEETKFHVFLNGPDAVVVKSGTAGGDAYVINEFVVGQIAVYDDEAMSLLGSTPLISVGGPCVNTVSMELMGNPEVCWEGFSEGKAKIKFWDSQSALLVAGYNGADTTGAAQVLANYETKDLTGDEVEVITTTMTVNVVS